MYTPLQAQPGSRTFTLMEEQRFWEWSQGVLKASQNFCGDAIFEKKKMFLTLRINELNYSNISYKYKLRILSYVLLNYCFTNS